MKRFLSTLFFLFLTNILASQEAIVSSGGNVSGAGSVSYTIGQIIASINTGSNGSVSQGIQQSLELFTLSNQDNKNLTLQAIMYPNPTKDKVVLSIKDNVLENLIFSMYDSSGRLLKKGKIKNDNTTIPMKNFASGIYLLKVYRNTKSLKIFKIIKN